MHYFVTGATGFIGKRLVRKLLEREGSVVHVPRIAQVVMNTSFRVFPDSSAAKGGKDGERPQLSAVAVAMQQMMRGIHF